MQGKKTLCRKDQLSRQRASRPEPGEETTNNQRHPTQCSERRTTAPAVPSRGKTPPNTYRAPACRVTRHAGLYPEAGRPGIGIRSRQRAPLAAVQARPVAGSCVRRRRPVGIGRGCPLCHRCPCSSRSRTGAGRARHQVGTVPPVCCGEEVALVNQLVATTLLCASIDWTIGLIRDVGNLSKTAKRRACGRGEIRRRTLFRAQRRPIGHGAAAPTLPHPASPSLP